MKNDKIINLIEGKINYLKLKLDCLDVNKEQKEYFEVKIELKRLDYLLEKAKYNKLIEEKGKIKYQPTKVVDETYSSKRTKEDLVKIATNLKRHQ